MRIEPIAWECECGGIVPVENIVCSACKRLRPVRERPARDPLWADFQQAALMADAERLADIGDKVLRGESIDHFDLTENERIVVEAYVLAAEGETRDA